MKKTQVQTQGDKKNEEKQTEEKRRGGGWEVRVMEGIEK